MTTRRDFVRLGIAASALGAAPLARSLELGAATTRGLAAGRQWPLFAVLVDRTLAAAPAFSAALARRAAPILSFAGDAGDIWMHSLEPRLRRSPVAISGFTGGGLLFCLELLARSYGLRTVYRIEHVATSAGASHAVEGAHACAPWSDLLDGAQGHWIDVAAALATSCPSDVAPPEDLALVDVAAHGRVPSSVFSWLIAPRSRSDIPT